MRNLLKFWLPVLAWTSLIFFASSDLMSAQQTSRFIGPFLRWFDSDISPEKIAAVQFWIRKAAHVTEYAFLGALLLRALHRGMLQPRWRYSVLSFALAAFCAALDEYRQSFVTSRTGSVGDVFIDASGALLGITVCWWLLSRRGRSTNAATRQSVPSAR